ncbi:MAG TPA: choline/carnitine O-acyltransferase, partial [Vicinamibacterales bacterium]
MDAFPTPDSTFRKLAESTIAGPLRRKLLLSLLNRLGIIDSAEAARRRMIGLAERGLDPFDLRSIPVGPSGAIYPEFSFSILFEKTGDPPAQRAAKLAHAALRYRQSLLDNSLEIERSGGAIIDNSRNHNLFGRVANLRKTGLRLNKQVKDCKHSSHIVAAVDGAFYKLDVIDAGGAILAADSIFRQINSILHATAKNGA